MRVLIAPDKFKGSLTAQQICDTVASALGALDPDITCIKLPLADGGDGTAVLLTQEAGGTVYTCAARDPLFRKIEVTYGITPDGTTAIVDMASASGLARLKREEYNPFETSSVGTGDIIRYVIERHPVSSFIVGVGGTATNDGGIGMAAALGARFYDEAGDILHPVGENLYRIHRIDLARVHTAVQSLSCMLLCDVTNPLFGPEGAAAVFGPQKGATPAMIPVLDEGLYTLYRVIQNQFHRSVNFAGAGAAGGFPAMLTLLMNTQIQSGTEFVTRFTDLESKICQADVVITGEGRVDAQTLSGKLISGVAALARRHGKPLIVLAGSSELTPEQLNGLGIHKLITLVTPETPPEKAMADAVSVIRKRINQNFEVFQC